MPEKRHEMPTMAMAPAPSRSLWEIVVDIFGIKVEASPTIVLAKPDDTAVDSSSTSSLRFYCVCIFSCGLPKHFSAAHLVSLISSKPSFNKVPKPDTRYETVFRGKLIVRGKEILCNIILRIHFLLAR
jgi:hypothetical protein